MAEARRSSILKPPKQRAPLQEVNSLNVHHNDDFTSTTVTQNIMRRVSFAGTSTVKEFDTQAESVLVCHTPAYEESFAASDSSVPSDHSSRFLSHSTISIEDQSTHHASSEGILREIVQTEDELFVDFMLSKPSQPVAKDPQRRARFSIGITSDEEESPKVQEKGPGTIPPSFFFGKEKPKPKKSSISSPQVLKIDPFSLRPKAVAPSPKLQLKRKSLKPDALPSPKSKSPALQFATSPNDSTSSEMELTEAISGNIFVASPSPSSVATGENPQSVATPQSMEFTSIGASDWINKTTHDDGMELTRVMPATILESSETRSSLPGDGSVHCTFRNSVMMELPQPVTGVAIRNKQLIVTKANQIVTCTSNSVVTGLSRSVMKDNAKRSLPATLSRAEDIEAIEVVCRNAGIGLEFEAEPSNVAGVVTDHVSIAELNTARGLEFPKVASSLQNEESRHSGDDRNMTICEPDGMDFTRVRPDFPVLEGDEKQFRGMNQTLNESACMDMSEAVPSAPILQDITSAPTAFSSALNNTLNDSMGMDLTEAIPYVPQLHTPGFGKSLRAEQLNETLNDSVGMEFTKVILSAPEIRTPGLSESFRTEPFNKTMNDTVGMDFTKAIPTVPQLHTSGLSKSLRSEPFNKTMNDSVAMDFTKAIPTVPQLHTPGLSKSLRSEPLNKTMNDSVAMDFTKPIPTVPQLHTPGLSKSLRSEPLNKTMNDSVAMDFTKAIPTAPQLHTPGRSKLFQTEPFNKIMNDTVGMDLTKAIPTVPQLHTPGLSKSLRSEPLNKTMNDSVAMDFTKAIPTVPQLHTPGLSKSLRSEPLNKTMNDTVGMDFTKAIPTAPQILPPGFGKSIRIEPLNKTLNDTVGMELSKAIPTASFPLMSEDNCFSNERVLAQKTSSDSMHSELTQTVPANHFKDIPKGGTSSLIQTSDGKTALLGSLDMDFTDVCLAPVLLDSSKTNDSSKCPLLKEDSSIKAVEIEKSPSPDPRTISTVPATSIPISVIDTMSQRTESTTVTCLTKLSVTSTTSTSVTVQPFIQPSDIEASVLRAEGIRTILQSPTQETIPLTFIEANLSRTDCVSSRQMSVQETLYNRLLDGDLAITLNGSVTASSQGSLTSRPKVQLSRKRSIDEVDGTEPDEIATQISRRESSFALIDPSEIVIPSSRSPTPDEQDSSTRFPGLSQSFSVNRSLTNSESTPSVNPSVRDDALTQEYHHTTSAKGEEAPACAMNEVSSSILVESVSSPANLPVHRLMEATSDGTPSSSTSEVLRKFSTPDEYNVSDVSLKTKTMSPDHSPLGFEAENQFHKSCISDVSTPSMLESETSGIEQDVSSTAKLFETILQAENNVSLFQYDRVEDAFPIEESTNVCCEVSNEAAIKEKSSSDCEVVEREAISGEYKSCRRDSLDASEVLGRERVEERRTLREDLKKSVSRTLEDKAVERSSSFTNSLIESSRLIEPDRRSFFDRSSTSNTVVSRTFAASRPAEEIIRAHRLEYRKRVRCNWTSQKSGSGEWRFLFLDDSVELRINVEDSSRNQLLSGNKGRCISLLDDSLDGLWHIGGRLLYQKLSSEKWTSRLQKTDDVLGVLEDVNREANVVEKFKTTLANLQITKNIDITNDWISFDVLSRKTSTIWFKVKVDCRDVLNLQQSHISIENIIGETRLTDIQNLVTCVKKDAYIFQNYVAVVEEYLETIERIQ